MVPEFPVGIASIDGWMDGWFAIAHPEGIFETNWIIFVEVLRKVGRRCPPRSLSCKKENDALYVLFIYDLQDDYLLRELTVLFICRGMLSMHTLKLISQTLQT